MAYEIKVHGSNWKLLTAGLYGRERADGEPIDIKRLITFFNNHYHDGGSVYLSKKNGRVYATTKTAKKVLSAKISAVQSVAAIEYPELNTGSAIFID